jgi:hypothetical protein
MADFINQRTSPQPADSQLINEETSPKSKEIDSPSKTDGKALVLGSKILVE